MEPIILSQHVRDRSPERRLQWDDGLTFLRSAVFRKIQSSDFPEVVISLRNFDYLDADGLLWLLLFGDFLRASGKSPWLELPSEERHLKYLSASSFLPVAQEVFAITNLYYLDDSRERTRQSAFRFWRVDISTLSTIIKTTTLDLHRKLAEALDIDLYNELGVEVIQPFVVLLTEINRNLVQHSRGSEGEGWGYFVLDVRETRKGRRLTFTVGDAGRGFRSSLVTKGMHLRNDEDAIKHALLFRYNNQEGEGLFRAIQVASRLNGVVKLHSGRGAASINLQRTHLVHDNQVRQFIHTNLRSSSELVDFPGVQFYVEIMGRDHGRK